MKITAVETLRLKRHATLIWVRLHTDEGLTGLGESWFGTAAIEADVHDRIAPAILGQDPSRIEHLHAAMRPYVGFYGTSTEIRALSAADVALWDIAGKVSGRPLCDLLGGRTRDRVRLYNTCAGPDYVSQSSDVRPGNFGLGGSGDTAGTRYEDLTGFMERPAEVAAELLDMGIGAMKIWPFDFAEGAADGVGISVADLKRGLKPFEEIRAAHGDRMRLKAELHGIWGLGAAKTICRALEPIGMDWVEDPIWMDRIQDLRELMEATAAPLAGGETLGGLGQIRELIELGGIATPIIDVTWGGGITFARKAAGLAEAAARPIAFHDCSGPVTLAVSTHLALAAPNIVEQEFTRAFYYGWYHRLVTQLPPIENGMITVPDGPGLGLELAEGLERAEDAISIVTRL
ncbi:mandelate racemase/muconate lactonizing enzyme family protein [Acuticoccus sediminis]|uniref:mandelate racemase/muconate lactonizing enzyme family protein n=1 Tax=Acuticoccus sediminis TaxID=2184697 RepID=UPI001CFC62AD|nr:mandelate racemase/muconate lactonizing enzyme family protein [Acuticoccus sediminis]